MVIMKNAGKIILVVLALGSLFVINGCKKDSGPGESVEDVQLGKLSKTWNATTVQLDGTDQAGYNNFSLTISGTPGNTSFGYTAAGRPQTSPWPSSGTWSFGATPETQIVRDPGTGDELAMTYSVTDTQLQITFAFTGTGYPGGKTSNVNGQWVFTFAP